MNSVSRTLAICGRVLTQIRHDRRSVALLLFVPALLTGLFSWMLNSDKIFNTIGPRLVGLFPFMVMFLLSSITTLRERRSGTLERFLTTPMKRGEFIAGYALSFGTMAALQATITLVFAIYVCNLELPDEPATLFVAAIANALLGMALGLLASAFAATEFQVIQFLPAFVFPQLLLGGLFVPIDTMPDVLQTASDWMPLSHALRSLNDIVAGSSSEEIWGEIGIVFWVSIGALAIGAFTLRKRTP